MDSFCKLYYLQNKIYIHKVEPDQVRTTLWKVFENACGIFDTADPSFLIDHKESHSP